MPYCGAFGCHSDTTNNTAKLHFFRFPLQKHDKGRLKQWIHFCNRSNFQVSKYSTLCSLHFSRAQLSRDPRFLEQYGYKNAKPRLLPTAVPDIPLIIPGNPAKQTKERGAFAKRRRHEIVNEILEQYEKDEERSKSEKTSTKHNSTTGECSGSVDVKPHVSTQNLGLGLQLDRSFPSRGKKRKISSTMSAEEVLTTVTSDIKTEVKSEPLANSELRSPIAENAQVKLESVSPSDRTNLSQASQGTFPASLTEHRGASAGLAVLEMSSFPLGLTPGSILVPAQGPLPGSVYASAQSNMNIQSVSSNRALTNLIEHKQKPSCFIKSTMSPKERLQNSVSSQSVAMSPSVTSKVNAMSSIMPSPMNVVSSIARPTRYVMSSDVPSPKNVISSIAPSPMNIISSSAPLTMDAMSSDVPSTLDDMSSKVPSTSDAMSSEVPSTFDAMSADVPSTLDDMSSEMPSTLDDMSSEMSSTLVSMSSNMPSPMNAMSSNMQSPMNAMSSNEGVSSEVPSTVSAMSSSVPLTLNDMTSDVPSTVDALSSEEPSGGNVMSSYVPSPMNVMSSDVPSPMNEVSSEVPSTLNIMSSGVPSTSDAMSSEVPSTVDDMSSDVPSALNAISPEVPSTEDSMSASVSSTVDAIDSSVSSFVQIPKTALSAPLEDNAASSLSVLPVLHQKFPAVKTVYVYIPRPAPDVCDASTQTMESDYHSKPKAKLDKRNVTVKREKQDDAADAFSPESVGKSNITDLFKYYTGFSFLTFTALFNFLFPNSDISEENPVKYTFACEETEHMPLYNQLFLVLCRLRQGFGLKDLAFRFKIQPQTACVIFDSVVHYMYLRLKGIPLWPQRPSSLGSLPPTTKPVMSIFGYIELKTLKPTDEDVEADICPDYKANSTLKGLVAVNTKGDVSFVSVLFSGGISEKEICKLSGFLGVLYEQKLNGHLADHDNIIGTKTLMMKKDFSKIGLCLRHPPTILEDGSDGKSLHTSEVVERRIEKICEFKLIGRGIPASLDSTINEVWFVCAVLTNFQNIPIPRSHSSDDSPTVL